MNGVPASPGQGKGGGLYRRNRERTGNGNPRGEMGWVPRCQGMGNPNPNPNPNRCFDPVCFENPPLPLSPRAPPPVEIKVLLTTGGAPLLLTDR